MKMELRPKVIDKIYKRRDRIEMPDFQREEVWSDEKKRLLIDTILKGWHLPKFYFRKVDDVTFECVDGQQRLVAIWEFFGDKLTLKPDMAETMGGTKYSELPDKISDAFDDYIIDIEEIEDATDDELEELFLRLQFGTPLNTAEKLNAIGGRLKEFCQWVSSQPFFNEKITLKDTRYSHFEISAKWLFIETRGIQPRMRYPQLEAFLKENRAFSKKSQTAQRVSAALDYLNQAFPNRTQIIKNRASALSVCMLAARIIEQGLHRGTATIFGHFVEDFFTQLTVEVEKGIKSKEKELLDYQQAVSYGLAEGDSIKTRINILTKRIATYSHQFSGLLGAYRDAEKGAIRSISDQAEIIKSLIHNVNRKYAAMHGEDLFKMTNEASYGLQKLSHPCRSQNNYAGQTQSRPNERRARIEIL